MKKKQIANMMMVAMILVILAAGVLTVGYLQGWFDKDDGTVAVLTEVRGIVNLEREGVAYPAEKDTVLRSDDRITCQSGATAVIRLEEGYLTLGEKAAVEVMNPAAGEFAAGVTAGEVFVNAAEGITLSFDGRKVVFADTVACLSVRSGAQSVSVFAGSVEAAEAGQVLNWVGNTLSVNELSIKSLNDFHIAQLRIANESETMCFTNAELDELVAGRWAEMQAQLNQTQPTQVQETQNPEAQPSEATEPTQPAQTTQPGQETPPQATQPSETKPMETQPAETKPAGTQPPETQPVETQPSEPQTAGSCTITIRCETILDNWDKLDPAKAGYVPGDGVILYPVTVSFAEGETVFDVLKQVCGVYGIQLEYSWTPIYDSYYVEGINHLYEFDCGSQSGWMYKVNGWFPNYGCSGYTLSDGDSIVWCYTCNGYGSDVGA